MIQMLPITPKSVVTMVEIVVRRLAIVDQYSVVRPRKMIYMETMDHLDSFVSILRRRTVLTPVFVLQHLKIE